MFTEIGRIPAKHAINQKWSLSIQKKIKLPMNSFFWKILKALANTVITENIV